MLTLTLKETDQYFFDEAAADRVCRFFPKFIQHYEGKFAGQPFILLDWQINQIIRPLFGWKRKDSGLRRFQEMYLLSGKGAGKTPVLSGIGLFELLADGEKSPHVISLASTFEQANLTFDAGKKYIQNSPELSKFAEINQYQIKANAGGKWTINSGKPNGRSGSRPSCVIADEIHEWQNGEAYKLVTANMFKRSQPLTLLATNAGKDRQCYAWSLHERAVAVATGKEQNDSLLPIIFEAPIELTWDSEAAAAAANPSLGQIVQFDQLAPKLADARRSIEAQGEYERLYLSRWTGMGAHWLDMSQWDSCQNRWEASATPPGSTLLVGMDLSEGDDLCGVTYVWPTTSGIYVDSEFWIPRSTAERYEKSHGVPYSEWETAGAIHVLDSRTISPEVRRAIAASIIARSKGFKLKAVCYDAYRAEDCIAALEKASIVCVPIRQGFSLSPGCRELERRLTEKSIFIQPNPVLRANAENVEIKGDDRGNIWPVKPNAFGKYAGKRSAKVDGICALVTALTEARKLSFAKNNFWKGAASLVPLKEPATAPQ